MLPAFKNQEKETILGGPPNGILGAQSAPPKRRIKVDDFGPVQETVWVRPVLAY